jgi:hypothetical protein
MHRLMFFPIGNADCCRIDLESGQKLLSDFADMRDPSDPKDKRIDLPAELRSDLKAAGREDFDVVAFTHLDDDHIHGASGFFYLEHAAKYQDKDRIKIRTLWVPAAAITEEGAEDEARVLRAEARYRLKAGKGIRVFSRPERLREWLEANGLKLQDRAHLITDAGQLIPGYSKLSEGVEFFVHSPFAKYLDGGRVEDRNSDALIFQATFLAGGQETKLIMSADAPYDVLADVVTITRRRGNDVRLESDVFKLPHHCSYTSLGPDKGKDKTKPVPEVAWLFETQSQDHCIIVSPSWAIPTSGDDDQPPHRQAAAYYRDVVGLKGGEFEVTMEHPKVEAPEPLLITIGSDKARISKKVAGGAAAVVSSRPPRAGCFHG